MMMIMVMLRATLHDHNSDGDVDVVGNAMGNTRCGYDNVIVHYVVNTMMTMVITLVTITVMVRTCC